LVQKKTNARKMPAASDESPALVCEQGNHELLKTDAEPSYPVGRENQGFS
jgi:hypothetical protein